jgi:hypothetical protein
MFFVTNVIKTNSFSVIHQKVSSLASWYDTKKKKKYCSKRDIFEKQLVVLVLIYTRALRQHESPLN